MVVVQPLLVATIVFSLPIARVVTNRRIRRIEWIGAITGGRRPGRAARGEQDRRGHDDASLAVWLAVGGACVAIALVLFLLARGRNPALRAGLLGTAAGILFGLAAALTKAALSRVDEGIVEVVVDWHLYAMIVISVAAFWLQQAALQTGALSAAVASSMAFDPLSSIPLESGSKAIDEATAADSAPSTQPVEPEGRTLITIIA